MPKADITALPCRSPFPPSRCTKRYANAWSAISPAGITRRARSSPAKPRWCSASARRGSRWGGRCASCRSAACWTAWRARARTCAARGRGPREGLLFGLVIPNLGETEIFEPICQGIAASPEARGHGLLWAHADQGVESREEQALELARYCIARSVAGVFFAPLEFSAASAEVNARVMKLLHARGSRWCCWTAGRKNRACGGPAIWWASTIIARAIWRRSTCCGWARGGWASCAWRARPPP